MQQIQDVRQRLRRYVRKFKQEGDTEKQLAKQLQQERAKRLRAESDTQREREGRLRAEGRLRELRDGAGAPAVTAHTHALPDPDDTMNKFHLFRALISALKPGKMLDLGAGRGNFSVVGARFGWDVTAVDARTVRWPEPGEDPNRAKLIRSVNWVQADVREFPIDNGEYDLICILGLLHHLEVEDQIELLKRCSGTLTLMDVRIAPKITDTDGPYEGEYIREHGETREERDLVPTASWGNEVSFRHTEESLLRLVRDCGYGKMMTMKPPHRENYTMFLCLPIS
jgi:2-polyprenyl-3-methyl-5-hydroxy-6-metoxy-1,4-benzoquinol methylase